MVPVLPPAPVQVAICIRSGSSCAWPTRMTAFTACRIGSCRGVELDSRRRFDGRIIVRPSYSTPARLIRWSTPSPARATAAGLPLQPVSSDARAAAGDDESELLDPDQQQRELRPFLVPSPNRGMMGLHGSLSSKIDFNTATRCSSLMRFVCAKCVHSQHAARSQGS